jgi:hypothetical protein
MFMRNYFIKEIVFFGFILLAICPSLAQEASVIKNQDYMFFSESKTLNENDKVVYFCFSEIKNEAHKQNLITALESQDFIKSVRIYKDMYGYDRCQMTVLQSVKPEKVRGVLIQNNTDFKFVSVLENKPSQK